MRWSTPVLIAGLAALGAPLPVYADCPVFSPAGPACVTPTSKRQVDFGKLAAANAQAQKLLAEARRAMAASVPTDCKMIKPVDPRFASKMPVQTPDPNLKLPIRTVQVPSCAAPDGSDERR